MGWTSPPEGWGKLPFHIKLKTGDKYTDCKAFYNAERDEVIHHSLNTRKTYHNRHIVKVAKTTNGHYQKNKILRRLIPKVNNHIVNIRAGISGRTLFEKEADSGNKDQVRAEAVDKFYSYMESHPR